MLGLSEHQVRVIAPFIGGGFGPKIMMFYPEEVLIPWLALRSIGRSSGSRTAPRTSSPPPRSAGRSTTPRSRSTRDGRILGVQDAFLHDTGAYDPYGLTVPLNSQCTLLGPYRVPAYDSEFRAVFTNKTDRHALPRRRPPARRVRHRAAARPRRPRAGHRPHRDPPAQLPASRRVPARPRDHLPGLRPALPTTAATTCRCSTRRCDMIGWDSVPAARSSRACGPQAQRWASASSPTSRAPASAPTKARGCRSQPSGKVTVATGVGTQGQGHFTVLAQIAADQLGVEVDDVRRGHRRHRPVPLGHRHLRQPRRRRRRQRHPTRRRRACARSDPSGRRAPGSAPRTRSSWPAAKRR